MAAVVLTLTGQGSGQQLNCGSRPMSTTSKASPGTSRPPEAMTWVSPRGRFPPGGRSANRFLYCRTPWGSTLELISYPDPQPYQQHTTVRLVAAGEALLSPAISQMLIDINVRQRPASKELPEGLAELTSRELEVFRQLVNGKSNAEIASELFLTEGTVEDPYDPHPPKNSRCGTASRPRSTPSNPASAVPEHPANEQPGSAMPSAEPGLTKVGRPPSRPTNRIRNDSIASRCPWTGGERRVQRSGRGVVVPDRVDPV